LLSALSTTAMQTSAPPAPTPSVSGVVCITSSRPVFPLFGDPSPALSSPLLAGTQTRTFCIVSALYPPRCRNNRFPFRRPNFLRRRPFATSRFCCLFLGARRGRSRLSHSAFPLAPPYLGPSPSSASPAPHRTPSSLNPPTFRLTPGSASSVYIIFLLLYFYLPA